jgi:uncharacterized membrane protein
MTRSATLTGCTAAAAIGCGAMTGVFFTFSGFVMAALRRLPAAQGVAAMQSVNVTAVRPPLMILLFGTALLCLPLALLGLRHRAEPSGALLLTGALLYLLGALAVTITRNVPMNDTLAALDPHSGAAAEYWHTYLRHWTAWNHLRALASLGAAAAFTLALVK